MRRMFSLALGLGAGIALGAKVMRRVDGVLGAARPGSRRVAADVRDRLGSRVGAIRADTRRLAAEREAELRARYAVPELPRRADRH